jgi:tetratricopeptide (TPR) repeat protein
MALWERFLQSAVARVFGKGACLDAREHLTRRRLEQTVATQAGRFGVSDCRTLAARIDLANYLCAGGAYNDAQEQYDQALYWYRQIAGEYDPNVLVLKFTQAQTFLRDNDLLSAKTLLLHIYGASRKVSGSNHHATLLYLDSLAATLVRLGDHSAARQTIAELLARRQGLSQPSECSATLATASVLVTSLLNAAQHHEALPIQEGILALLRQVRRENDPETLLATSLYATILIECGELSPARLLLEKIYKQFVDTLGRDHNQTLTVGFLLGAVMARQGDNLPAKTVLERAYPIAKHVASRDSLTVRLGTELGTVLVRLRDYFAAQKVLSDLLPACESADGDNGSHTLTNLNNLAISLWEQGNLEQGLGMQEELVRRRMRRYGSAHRETVESMKTLAVMHSRLDRRREISFIAARARHASSAPEPSPSETEVLSRVVIGGAEIVTKVRSFQIPACKQ